MVALSRAVTEALQNRPAWTDTATGFFRAEQDGWVFMVMCFNDIADGTASRDGTIFHLPPHLRALARSQIDQQHPPPPRRESY